MVAGEQARMAVLQLTCPACGGGLSLTPAQIGGRAAIECEYCGTSVLVPGGALSQQAGPAAAPEPAQQPAYPDQGVSQGRRGWGVLLTVLLVSGAGIAASWFAEGRSVIPGHPIPSQQSYAHQTLIFGGKGTGPGLLNDPSDIAIDSRGGIWVADYKDGRISGFDAKGNFVRQMHVPEDTYGNNGIEGLAVDDAGHLFVARGGRILTFNTANGKLVGAPIGAFPNFYNRPEVDASGQLRALTRSSGDYALVTLDARGHVVRAIKNVISGVDKEEDTAGVMDFAVDGLGEVYVSNLFGDRVYHYDAKGTYVDRFGADGTGPGHIHDPQGIAVDGKDRVSLLEYTEVDQFDSAGTYLGHITWDHQQGAGNAMAVDRSGAVYVVTDAGKVLKFQLAKE